MPVNSTTFGFFHDSALTQPISSPDVPADPKLTATQDTANVLAAVDKVIYLGSTSTTTKLQAASNPGVDAITVTPVDANAGTGAPATEFKLALSSGGLAGATAGAALILSATITGGVANAIPIYTRRDSVLTTPGNYTDITLESNSVVEVPI